MRRIGNIKAGKLWSFLYGTAIALLVLNGLGNQVINTVALLFVVLLVLTARGERVLWVHPIIFVFFGFSNITMNTIGITLDISTIANILSLLVFVKMILHKRTVRINANSLLFSLAAVCCCLNIFLTNKLSQAVFMVARLYIVYQITNFKAPATETEETDGITRGYILSLFEVIVGETLYGLMFGNIGNGDTWRALQFCGVRDPNNLSLHCCLLLALILIIYPDTLKPFIRNMLAAMMIVIIVASLSFTGIAILAGILIIWIWKEFKGPKRFIVVVVLGIVAGILLLADMSDLIASLVGSSNMTISGLAQRTSLMLRQFSTGNYERLTSGRLSLWTAYYEYFRDSSYAVKLFGNSGALMALLQRIGIASHNIYIDFLISYGLIGMALIWVVALYNWFTKLKNRDFYRIIINLIFALIFFTRSFDLSVFFLFVLL